MSCRLFWLSVKQLKQTKKNGEKKCSGSVSIEAFESSGLFHKCFHLLRKESIGSFIISMYRWLRLMPMQWLAIHFNWCRRNQTFFFHPIDSLRNTNWTDGKSKHGQFFSCVWVYLESTHLYECDVWEGEIDVCVRLRSHAILVQRVEKSETKQDHIVNECRIKIYIDLRFLSPVQRNQTTHTQRDDIFCARSSESTKTVGRFVQGNIEILHWILRALPISINEIKPNNNRKQSKKCKTEQKQTTTRALCSEPSENDNFINL